MIKTEIPGPKFEEFAPGVIVGCHLMEPVVKFIAYCLMALAYALMIFHHLYNL